MPFTALAWNIEEFGVKFARWTSPMIAEDLRCQLVAAVAHAVQADVIVIQELRQQGVPFLDRLTVELDAATNKTWHFDWLPGAQTTAIYPPTLFSQLAFTQTGNSEGYGVVWRDGALAPFAGSKLSAGIDTEDPTASGLDDARDRYLGMIFSGRPLLFNDSEVDITYDNAKAYMPLGFPQSICPERNIITQTRSEARYESNISIQQQLNIRRPCHVKLNVTNAVTVPLVVFHTPVGQKNSRSQRFATYMGLASEPLQVADCVYAGDFNVKDPLTQGIMLKYTKKTLQPTYSKNTYAADDTPMRSMVHYIDKQTGDFRSGVKVFGSARDYGFARASATTPTLEVRDVLKADITDPNGAVRGALTEAAEFVATDVLPNVTNLAGVKVAQVLQSYMAGQPSPYGDDYTAAAVVYRTLISDHLPVVINFA